ncbi:MAG: hypothetical protein JNK05_18825 [Myxococcales bacterium]|nr:hypothetical protein [Myxococcales bacterium]
MKASIFRGLVSVLKQQGRSSAVEAKLSGDTLALVRSLPPASAWVDGLNVVELDEAIGAVLRDDELFELGRGAVSAELVGITRAATEGILRLFGTKPDALFSRMSMFDSVTARKVETLWRSTGPTSGEVRMRYTASKNLPVVIGKITAGIYSYAYDSCRVSGTITFEGYGNDERSEFLFVANWGSNNPNITR